MPDNQDTTLGTAATLIGCALEEYGIDAADLFHEAGLAVDVLVAPDVRYPFSKMQNLWRLAVQRSGDACFGLTVARYFQPQAMHGLGFLWLSSDTLMDALQRLVRYQRMISTVSDIALQKDDDTVRLVMGLRHSSGIIEPASVDAGVAVFVSMCRLAICHPFAPLRLQLKRPRPDCAERFEEFFGAPVEFAADANILHLDAALLDRPLPGANPELARANDQVVIDYLSRFDHANLSMQVRSRLIELLPGGQPTQKDVATELNLSVRNLQRRLHAEGISFKQLLDETRRELAAQYLQENHRRIGEITYLLGFSEPSNFTRAFRRWTGLSPNEYRHRA